MPDPDDAHDERAARTSAMDEAYDDAPGGDASHGGDAAAADAGADASTEALPADVVDEAERLTRLAREAVDADEADAYRADRDDTLADHDFVARVREDDAGETLVCHPAEWVADGTVQPDRIEDTDRAVEVSLSGAGDPDEWAAVDDHNRELAAAVRDAHGDAHGEVADALADFASNHYAKPIEALTPAELREFQGEYVTRNAWLDDDAVGRLEESVGYAFDAAEERVPDW